MPVDWTAYDAFDWSTSTQRPLDDAGRRKVATHAAAILGSPETDLAASASPPGRYAATVLRVHLAGGHPLTFPAGGTVAGLKLYKETPDATREGRRMVAFHTRQFQQLPGLPNPHVQRSFAAGMHGERAWLLQEWVPGDTLEHLVRRVWPAAPPDREQVASLLRQLFAGVVVPLWSAGLVWWDVRDANWVENAGRLVLIDTDSLAACADELLTTPAEWSRRESVRATAIPRLRATVRRLLRVAPVRRTDAGARWEKLEGALRRVGREATATAEALAATEALAEWVRGPALF